jgi:hypothetical protein
MMNNNENINMNCDEIQDLFVDFLDKTLDKMKMREVSSHIKSCEKCRKEFERTESLLLDLATMEDVTPPKDLRTGFNLMLNENKLRVKKENRLSWFSFKVPLLKYAGVMVIFVCGIFTGTLLKDQHVRIVEVPVAKNEITNPSVIMEKTNEKHQSREEGNQTASELNTLREEVNSLKSKMIFYMAKQSSPIDKIQAVTYVEKMKSPDDKLIETLFNLMNFDKSINVRSAAFNALSKFKRNSVVRKYLVESLEIQDEPSIQVSIINLLISMKDKNAIEPLNKLSENEKADKNVKYEASLALRKLRSL